MHRTRTRRPAPEALARLTVAAIAAVLTVCLVLGAVGALVGGSAARVGEGAGGLRGLPPLVLLGVAAVLGLPAAVLAAVRRQLRTAALLLVGPVTVALGYFFAPHAVDPCSLGLLDLGSTLGTQPLCESAAGSVSTNVRFHLLEHAVVTTALFVPWALLVLRLRPRRPRRVVVTAVVGGLLWSAYGPLELLQPFGADVRHDEERAYDVVVDPTVFVLSSLPGSGALLLCALALPVLARRLGSESRAVDVLAAAAAVLALVSAAGVAAQFDPAFTGPRILGTLVLALGVLAAARRAPSPWRWGLRGLGAVGLLLLPLWPVVFALQWLTPGAGAAVLAVHGLAWTAVGALAPARRAPAGAPALASSTTAPERRLAAVV